MNTKYDQFAIDIGVSKQEILEKKSIFKTGQSNNAMRYHDRNDGVFILSDNRFSAALTMNHFVMNLN